MGLSWDFTILHAISKPVSAHVWESPQYYYKIAGVWYQTTTKSFEVSYMFGDSSTLSIRQGMDNESAGYPPNGIPGTNIAG